MCRLPQYMQRGALSWQLNGTAIKNGTIPHFIPNGTLRISFEWICYENSDDVIQSGAVCSTMLNPPVSAGRVGMSSFLSHAVL